MKRIALAIFTVTALVACITPAPEPAPPPSYAPSPQEPSPPQAPTEPVPADPVVEPAPDSSEGPLACGANQPACASGSYCRYAANSCGEGAATGSCEPIPQICNRMFAPVCGCDGKTHSNSCTAAAQGVNIRSNGACESVATTTSCGGIAGKRCPEGSSCVDNPKDSCDPQKGGRDCIGICQAKTTQCTPVRCKMFCKNGWKVGPDGCETCACASN